MHRFPETQNYFKGSVLGKKVEKGDLNIYKKRKKLF